MGYHYIAPIFFCFVLLTRVDISQSQLSLFLISVCSYYGFLEFARRGRRGGGGGGREGV